MKARLAIVAIAMCVVVLLLAGCGGDTSGRGSSTRSVAPKASGVTSGYPAPGLVTEDDESVEVTGRLVYRTDSGGYFAIVDGPPYGALRGDERVLGVIVFEEGDRHGGDLQPLVNSFVQFDGHVVASTSESPVGTQFEPETMRILGDGTKP